MLFVTGMPRCGTTLVEKLVAQHPAISLLSQPFPFLFLDAKRAFLSTIGRGIDPYPLGDLFVETDYAIADFTRHLLTRQIGPETVRAVFAAMEGYSGQYTKADSEVVDAALAGMASGDLASTMGRLYAALSPHPGALHHGGKETGCEEFLPYLLTRGAHCLVIVRDPRDMLASLNHGRGPQFAGALKPTLFNLRQWRKSVAFVIHLRRDPAFFWLRYEDLVADPAGTLDPFMTALGVSPFARDAFAGGIRNADGSAWEGNSSHAARHELDASSVGRYRTVLPAAVQHSVEALCYPELRYLGYDTSLPWGEIPPIIAAFVEPYEGVREELRDRFGDPRRIDEELERIGQLQAPDAASLRYFLFDDTEEELRKVVVA